MSIDEFFKKISNSGLVVASQGNYSYRTELHHFFITRTNVPWDRLSYRSFHEVYKDAADWQTDGRASTDWRLHAGLYDLFPQVESILHTHPPYVIVYSMFHTVLKTSGHKTTYIPIVDEIVVTQESYDAVILRNHGLYVLSNKQEHADLLDRSKEIEHFAQVECLKRMIR